MNHVLQIFIHSKTFHHLSIVTFHHLSIVTFHHLSIVLNKCLVFIVCIDKFGFEIADLLQ